MLLAAVEGREEGAAGTRPGQADWQRYRVCTVGLSVGIRYLPPPPLSVYTSLNRYCLLAGIDYEPIREAHPTEIFTKVFTFNSARKSMTTVIPLPGGGYRMLTKGASEIVLNKCSFILGENGHVLPLSTDGVRDIVQNVVQPMATSALRTICLAYR